MYPYSARRAGHERHFSKHRKRAENDLFRISPVVPGKVLDQFSRTALGDNFDFASLMHQIRMDCRHCTRLSEVGRAQYQLAPHAG